MRSWHLKNDGIGRILFVAFFLLSISACSSGDSSPSTASAQARLSLSPSPASVAMGGNITLTPTGGTPPYTFAMANSFGSLSMSSGNYTVYTAPTSAGTAYISVTDSASNSTTFPITVGSGSGTQLALSPLNPSVAPGGSVSFSVTGGTAPYTYSVVTTGGGSFISNTYTAPSTAGSYVIQVNDSVGNSAQTTVAVGTSAVASSCEGKYNITITGGGLATPDTGSLNLIEDSSGNLGGYLTLSGFTYPMSGTCSVGGTTGTISMTNIDFNSTYSGTFTLNGSSGSSLTGSAQLNGGSLASWTATWLSAPATTATTSQSCEGTYNFTITGGSSPENGTMKMVEDNYGNFIGYLALSGYDYTLAGTCIVTNGVGTISFSDVTTGTTYTGTVSSNGTTLSMAGSLVSTAGNATWNASQQ